MTETKKLEAFWSPSLVWLKTCIWTQILVPLRIACKGSESLQWHLHALPLFDLLNALLNAREIQVEVV